MGANSPEWAAIMQSRLRLEHVPVDVIQDAIVDGMVERYRTQPSPVIAGAPEAVRRIAATRPVAIASSSHPRVIEAAIDALGLHGLFGAVVSSDDVPSGKPAPDVYLRAAELLGVPASRCVVVEDSLNGVRAGMAAGRVRRARPQPQRATRGRRAGAGEPRARAARRPRPGRAARMRACADRLDSARGAASHGGSRPPAVPFRRPAVVHPGHRPAAVPRPLRGRRPPARRPGDVLQQPPQLDRSR